MQTFVYERGADIGTVLATLDSERDACVIAGGTELVNWMKEGITSPARVIDINRLPGLASITENEDGLRIGALARMTDVAAHPAVRAHYPAIVEALVASASQQLRNMATMGGNLMQRTRCPYFRADTEVPCNKRALGSGCAALDGYDRSAAIVGTSEACIATHPSDVAVALAALDAVVHVAGAHGERAIAFEDFYRLPGYDPRRETTLGDGELITAITVPTSAAAHGSHYLKVRERASYEFALVSAAVAVDLDERTVRDVRIALGGVAPKPWRLRDVEGALRGESFTVQAIRAALRGALSDAKPGRANGFKADLAKRAVVRALTEIGATA